ncbi:MAG: sensor domain-containing diguanylate cyclase [Chloroflexota bacterium]
MSDSQSSSSTAIESAQRLLERLSEIVFSPSLTSAQPSDEFDAAQFSELELTLLELRQFLLALAKGDLSHPLTVKGVMAGALKTLQANLRHLTWQTQQVAQGDFSQRVEFMGEFSVAFNEMVAQLEAITNELQTQQDELIRRNDSLIYEVSERERAEAAERELREFAETLQSAAMALNSTLEFEAVLDIMLEKISDIVPYDSAVIMMVEGMTARTRRAKNYERYGTRIEEKVKSAVFDILQTPNLYTMLTSFQPMVVSDVDQYPHWDRRKTGNPVRSWVGTPVIAHGKVIAFFSLDKLEAGFYTPEHGKKLAMFANHAALALENARLFQEIQRLAVTDALTGLYNRRYFFERACEECERSCRYHHPVTMIMMDLDHFKSVNDTYGHPAGDVVLQTVSQQTRQALRNTDLAARFGGEEFIFLLPETPLEAGVQTAERLREIISERPIQYNGNNILLTASFGVSGGEVEFCKLPPPRAVEELIAFCDEALYQAKQAGRNRVSSKVPPLKTTGTP